MGDHPRRALGARRLAIRAGSRGPAWGEASGQGTQCSQQIRASVVSRLSGAVQETRWIERGGSLANLEMELGRVYVAGLAGARDHLTAFDLVAALDQELLGMRVSGDVA